ncbi:hypothetical protein Ddc_00700 [Ditylenchus destructor]|nr:hypothetical protein Ddc_00700 [Ditylenchus destructor]
MNRKLFVSSILLFLAQGVLPNLFSFLGLPLPSLPSIFPSDSQYSPSYYPNYYYPRYDYQWYHPNENAQNENTAQWSSPRPYWPSWDMQPNYERRESTANFPSSNAFTDAAAHNAPLRVDNHYTSRLSADIPRRHGTLRNREKSKVHDSLNPEENSSHRETVGKTISELGKDGIERNVKRPNDGSQDTVSFPLLAKHKERKNNSIECIKQHRFFERLKEVLMELFGLDDL